MEPDRNEEDETLLELHNLKLQQELLEKELLATRGAVTTSPDSGLVDVNTLQSRSTNSRAARADTAAELLEAMRRRHRRNAHRVMQQYLDTLSDFRGYQERRRQKLRNVQPFSFEERELRRAQSIRGRRMEEERLRREQEEQQRLGQRFKSSPVPPSTYMNKYELMLEEWRQRRALVEALAAEKAKQMKDEKELIQLSASNLRNVREVMGVRRERRTQSAGGQGFDGRNRRQVSEIRDIPIEVALKLWPAIEEHEHIRIERIKQKALQQMEEVKAEESQRLAATERTSRTQPRFGMTPVEFLQEYQQRHQHEEGSKVGNIVPVSGPIVTVPSNQQGTVSASVPLAPPSSRVDTIVMGPLNKPEPIVGATDGPRDRSVRKSFRRSVSASQNPNLTFKPKIRGGIPDFEMLWAEERIALQERKLKLQPTRVEPFNLTPSWKDEITRGRSLPPKKQQLPTSIPRADRRRRSKSKAQQSVKQAGEAGGVVETIIPPAPKGTRAHAMRTQAVFERYIVACEADEHGDGKSAETAALKEAYRRQKLVNARLKDYLMNTRVNTDDVIRKKVRELRRLGREAEREAAEQLNEMMSRVAQIPPLFVEPKHLHEAAKVRAETEKEILQLLRESGVDKGTLAAIIQGYTDASDDDDAAVGNNDGAVEAKEKEKEEVESLRGDEGSESSKHQSDGKVEPGEKASPSHSEESSDDEPGSREETEEGKRSDSEGTSARRSDAGEEGASDKDKSSESKSESKSGSRSRSGSEKEDDANSEYGTDFESASSGSAESV